MAPWPNCTAVNIMGSGLPLKDACWSYPCFSKRTFYDACLSPATHTLSQESKQLNMPIVIDSLVTVLTDTRCQRVQPKTKSCHKNKLASVPSDSIKSEFLLWDKKYLQINFGHGWREGERKRTGRPRVGWSGTVFQEKQPADIFPNSRASSERYNQAGARLCQIPGCCLQQHHQTSTVLVLWHTRMWVQWCHWWLIYILNELSIFHIILFESMML